MNTYRTASVLSHHDSGDTVELSTATGATPTGPVTHPMFFSGLLTRPDVVAACLLAVADVAASNYTDQGPAAYMTMTSLDPVVTGSGDRLRFESFSACNGVHARFDLLEDGIGGREAGLGTTNVDINQPLRTALASVGRTDLVKLSVGRDELQIATIEETHVERKVDLPDRWVRGFAEVPALARATEQVAQLSGPAVARFIGGLPKGDRAARPLSLAVVGRELRIVPGSLPGAFELPGTVRLAGLARLLRFATGLRVYRSAIGVTGWVLDVPGGRFTLLMSPDPYRGFSGEGTLLTRLLEPAAEAAAARLTDELSWQPVIDPVVLAGRTGLSGAEVEAGLAWLAACGRVGFDLAEGRWFHRELPVDADKILRRNPRLVSARKLAAPTRAGDGWDVVGSQGDTYSVRPRNGQLTCSCRWEADRGPCKHILAVHLHSTQRDSTHSALPLNT